MEAAQNFNGIQPNADAAKAVIASKIPLPPYKLSKSEQEIWDYVTNALFEYGLVHSTDGLVLSIICKTYTAWVDAEIKLAEIVNKSKTKSYVVKTPNGYEQPHQMYYVAQKLKKELRDWLPEAALTIPSFQKAVGDMGAPNQGALFDDPVEKHRKNKAKIGMVLINGGKSED